MADPAKDPTDSIRERASRYPGVDEGTACTQSAFKAGKKAFLYIGVQGGRCKAMFKLDQSLPEAMALARERPDDVQVGVNGWVTARFSADAPMPKRRWEKWLDESYALAMRTGAAKARPKAGTKPASKKPAARKAASKTRP